MIFATKAVSPLAAALYISKTRQGRNDAVVW
jgi:hypothetical protein